MKNSGKPPITNMEKEKMYLFYTMANLLKQCQMLFI